MLIIPTPHLVLTFGPGDLPRRIRAVAAEHRAIAAFMLESAIEMAQPKTVSLKEERERRSRRPSVEEIPFTTPFADEMPMLDLPGGGHILRDERTLRRSAAKLQTFCDELEMVASVMSATDPVQASLADLTQLGLFGRQTLHMG